MDGSSAALVIVIPGRPPTPNARGNAHAQWARAKEWRHTAAMHALAARVLEPIARCRLDVTFVVSQDRPRDLDNLVASTKPLTDGLVDAGVLVDDSDRVIESVTYRVRYQRGVQATEYRITPLESEQQDAGL